ncbi:hypothetical protein B0H19DRAFT_1072101 [Mycena capillaripes]|nr:hypothetical protein B0H19DRAFT_1072101 [Mycena capillaripes]
MEGKVGRKSKMGWVEGGGQNGLATLALYAKYSDAAAAPKLWLHGTPLECSIFQLGQYKDLELRVYWERFDRFDRSPIRAVQTFGGGLSGKNATAVELVVLEKTAFQLLSQPSGPIKHFCCSACERS